MKKMTKTIEKMKNIMRKRFIEYQQGGWLSSDKIKLTRIKKNRFAHHKRQDKRQAPFQIVIK